MKYWKSFGAFCAFAVIASMGYVNSCAAADCVHDLTEARMQFTDPGDRFSVVETFSSEQLMHFLSAATAGDADMLGDIVDQTKVIALGHDDSHWPPTYVMLGMFDAERCSVAAIGPGPYSDFATFMAILFPELPDPGI